LGCWCSKDRHRRFFNVRYDGTTERFIAFTRTNDRGDEVAFALRQQCFEPVVEEEALKGPGRP
jgi:hypothetical protein